VRKLSYLLFFAVLSLSACKGTSTEVPVRPTNTPIPSRPTPNAVELELSDPTKPIEVNTGDDFTITVRTNPSQDLHWELAQALDPKLIEYVWKNHVPDDVNNPNSSGRDVWRFKALAPGKATIILGYYQGMSDKTLEMFPFTVIVK
jgi:predicted secreted protein